MTDRAPTGFFDNVVDRTLANLRNVWREIATSTRGVLGGVQRSDLPDGDTAQLRQQMQSCLDVSGGEVSATTASKLGNPATRAAHATRKLAKSRALLHLDALPNELAAQRRIRTPRQCSDHANLRLGSA